MSDVIAEVPVVEVTVQEDRASVRRQGTVTLAPGRNRLRIDKVAPVLVDKSLVAQLQTPGGEPLSGEGSPRVLGVVARRWRVTEQSQRPEALAQLQTQLRQLRRTLETQRTRRDDLTAEHAQLVAVIEMTIAEISQDSGWATVDPPTSHTTLDRLQERLCAVGAERCQLESELHQQLRQYEDLKALEAASQSVEAHAAAAVEVEIEVPESAESSQTVVLRMDYLVPGALWRPWHRARLIEDEQGARVTVQCEGCVWQATGEDWTDVAVSFSTERPSLGLSPPPLHTDELHLRKRAPAVQVEARQQQIHTAGLGTEDTETADDVPGIDDGGEAQVLRGKMRTTIPGDGRPYRVPLFELTSPATATLLCVPELVPAVVLRTEQTNTARHPLLAGPVDLMRHSGLVGRTSTLYVAPGERFELGWGPDNALRVTREVEELEWERKTLSSWTRRPRRVKIKLSNLEGAARTIQVKERIAVSEIDKVKVELNAAEPRAAADADGFVQWDVRLLGLSRQQLTVKWTMVVHDDVQGI